MNTVLRPWARACCRWTVAALAALTLAGCAMVGYGECFSRCGGSMPRSFGAPSDPTRGALWNSAAFHVTDKYTIRGFITMERVGEPPGAGKVNAQAYVPDVSAQQAQGSTWFSATFGDDYVDPATLKAREGRILLLAPLFPPGIYNVTAQASSVATRTPPDTYRPFRSPAQSITVVLEAGKWSILKNSSVEIDESTQPMTVTVKIAQAGKESLAGMRKSGAFSFSPEFVIADPLPPSASSIPPVKTGAP